jgi:hypothetical protein
MGYAAPCSFHALRKPKRPNDRDAKQGKHPKSKFRRSNMQFPSVESHPSHHP